MSVLAVVATPTPCPGRSYSSHRDPRALEAVPDLPEFTLGRVFSTWGIEPLLFVLTVWVAGAYLVGVAVLHRRGDRWPLGRTFSFVVVGMGVFLFVTSSGIGAYDTTLLSVHMVQHMALTMVVPLALALGAPVTLALRTLPRRPRGWLLGGAALAGRARCSRSRRSR